MLRSEFSLTRISPFASTGGFKDHDSVKPVVASMIYKAPVHSCKRSFVLCSAQPRGRLVFDTVSEHLVERV